MLKLASPPDFALEVGCEGGRWVRVLCDAGWRMRVTDIDADVIAICRERNPSAECLLVSPSDITLQAEDATVGLLMCLEVLPVITSNWFIPECARVLKPGGWVVATYYNSLSLRGWAYRLKYRLKGQSEAPYYRSLPYHKYRRKWREVGFRIACEDGYAWGPFSRRSDSPLIPLATGLERACGLNRIVAFSPCVAFIAQKP